ncbi:MAG TPA: VTT domain-containing protein [Chloroflexota bacterium]|nr:VTT domain-containing protein [Chloroflexota bacterium]
MGPDSAENVGALSQLFEAALYVFGRHAPSAAFVAAFIESLVGLGVVFPGGTIVILAAYAMRAEGGLGFVNVVAAAAAGMTLGTVADYWIGRLAGRRLVPRRAPWRLACRWRHMLRSSHGFMSRWGWWAVIAANLAGPGRAAVAVAAGASGWSFGAYLTGQAIASIAWSTLYCGIGFFAAREAMQAEQIAGSVAIIAVGLVAVAVVAPTVLAWAFSVLSRWIRPPFVQPLAVPADTGTSSRQQQSA